MVHVLWVGGVGGIERLVQDLAGAQSEEPRDVGIALARTDGPLTAAVGASGIPIVDLRLGSGYDIRPGRLASAAALLASWDVVHLHGFNVPLALAVRRAGRPVVFTDHGSAPRGGRRVLPDLAKRGLQAIFLRRYVDAVTANSRHTAARTSKLYGVPRNEVTTIYNGVAPDAQGAVGPASEEEGALVVAFVGRLVGFKRVDRLLQAAALVQPDQEIRVLVIGSGPLERELRSLAERLSLEKSVTFLGVRTDVATLLQRADVLVQPSEGEPFGLAILEGCALGLLPIVFSDGGGALEVVPPDGRVVTDVADLVATLKELVGSSALSLNARRARSAWAFETFPIQRTADAYGSVYGMVVDAAQPAVAVRAAAGVTPP